MTTTRLRRTAFLPPEIAMGAAVWLASILLQMGLMDARVLPYDEGLILYGAAHVARGNVPYRDFWMEHPPIFPAFVTLAYQISSRFVPLPDPHAWFNLVLGVLMVPVEVAGFLALRRLAGAIGHASPLAVGCRASPLSGLCDSLPVHSPTMSGIWSCSAWNPSVKTQAAMAGAAND